MQWTAALAAGAAPGLRAAALAQTSKGYRPQLLPVRQEVWDQQVWMAKLGPKYTGNKAHTEFVEFLATGMQRLGLDVERMRYTFPRWEAGAESLKINTPGTNGGVHWPLSSYFPYSGQTGPDGVTGGLVYVGKHPDVTLTGLQGKVALVDFTINTREWSRLYKAWGVHPAGETVPDAMRPARAVINDLTPYAKAGAMAVIIVWTDVSNDNAADQYSPFSRPPQGIPGVYVNRSVGARLRDEIAGRGQVTVTLPAETFPDSPTETIVATLPGATDETIILNTHTDGPNATEENGALGLLTLAKYFSKIPKAERRRTLVFPMTTGHFAGPWVPSIRGYIEKHPDVIKRTVAAVCVEHLGCREWLDVTAAKYAATGKNEWSVAITPSKPMADALVAALDGSVDRAAVVNPVGGGFLGEGNSLSRAGIPAIGYIPQPNYLLAGPADGCIDKLSPELLHSQIEVFAKLVHRLDGMSAEALKA